jgi:hypothetical protein
MRKLIALLTIFSLNTYAAAPTGVGGEQGALSYTNNLKAPNYQVTALGGVNSRVETGNTNLLMNPSFEHPTVATGWTVTNATGSDDVTNQVEGKKAISLAVSGAMTFGQDSTVNAANLAGLQGVASVKIKATGTTGLKVCPRNAGAAITNLCVNVTADNTWKHISIPFILGITSNGIGIATTATGGTVIVDDAFVGTSAPFQDVSGARLVGTVTYNNCGASWTTTSTSYTAFTAQTCTPVSTGSALNNGVAGSYTPSISFSSLPAGDYRLELEGYIGSSGTSDNALFQFWDGANTAREQSSWNGSGGATVQTNGLSQTISYSTAQSNVTFSIRAKVTGTSTATIIGTSAFPSVIKVWYFPPATKIYSQASQDVSYQACTFSTLAWNGLGTVTNNLLCARKGDNLLIKGKFTTGTVTATTTAIPLPTNFGSIAINSSISSNQIVGNGQREVGSAGIYYNFLASPGGTTLAVSPSVINSTNNPITNASGSTTFASTEIQNILEIKIPIQGWQDYGVIVGSFAGIEKCANDYECTDTFSAQISSTGVVSNENLDWINGNCTVATNIFTCVYNTNLKDGISPLSSQLNCSVTTNNPSAVVAEIRSGTSTTQFQYETYVSTSGGASAQPAHIKCQKGSQDYKAKTGKIASSNGVPTVPGLTGSSSVSVDTFSVSYGATIVTNCTVSPCAYLDQIGTIVNSITRTSTGTYSLNLGKTYSKLKCSIVAQSSGAYGFVSPMSCSSCSTLSFTTANYLSAAQDSYGTLICQGSY